MLISWLSKFTWGSGKKVTQTSHRSVGNACQFPKYLCNSKSSKTFWKDLLFSFTQFKYKLHLKSFLSHGNSPLSKRNTAHVNLKIYPNNRDRSLNSNCYGAVTGCEKLYIQKTAIMFYILIVSWQITNSYFRCSSAFLNILKCYSVFIQNSENKKAIV